MSNHPDTVFISNWYHLYHANEFLANIPQPAYIVIDTINSFSNTMPNIFIHIEPNIICQNIENYLINNHMKYHTIFTYNTNVLDKCPNAKLSIFGTCWIPKDYYMNMDTSRKEFKISMLASNKNINNAEGHNFRQLIHHNQNRFKDYPITFFRSFRHKPEITDYGNNPFINDSKIDLFNTFQFSIIIENSKQINYFTEKIVDCLVTKTIPIYWGCPNISDFFDTTGWIILNTSSLDEIIDKLKILSKDYYEKYTDNIEQNYHKAISYSQLVNNINNAK
jgi:hypothetical protein